MVSRRTKVRKNTLRRRKVKRRGHSRRQRGGSSGPSSANRASGPSSANRVSGPSPVSVPSLPGPPINIYLQLTGTSITNPSCDGPLVLSETNRFSTRPSIITVNFKVPIKFAGATWSKWLNGRWIPVGTYLTTNPNSSYVFQATPTGTNVLKTIKKAGIPIGATNIAMPASGGISTSTITINNITTNTSNFAAGVSTTSSPTDNKPVNIRITLNTLQ